MNTSLQYFLLIAKEQSIVRAAEQLYITPQNLSNHVKRLEQEYGTLFTRYPHFGLTPAGEALVETLQKIEVLEKGLSDRLKELNEEIIGNIDFGIHPLRARVLLPRVMPVFARAFPQVHVTIHGLVMNNSIKKLQNGEIDAFFGIDTPALPEFDIIPLKTEKIFFVASRELLEQNGVAGDAPVIAMEELPRFSYLLSPQDSHFRPKINSFCEQTGISLRERITITDFSLQLTFASQGLGACFTPESVMSVMHDLNRNLPPREELRALTVEGLAATVNLAFVMHRLSCRTAPLKGLLRAFQEAFE